MMWLSELFDTGLFMPHGHCYLWQPGLVGTMVLANAIIGTSYVAISIMLAGLVYKIRDLPFKLIYVAFGTFIISCGITHFSDIYVIWHPTYWLDASLRLVTAIASVGTALVLPSLLPRAMALASGARAAHARGIALQTAVHDLETMYKRSKQLEELKSQFFANVSHELRTPLTLILGPLEKLLRQKFDAKETAQALPVIERNARLLLKHVNDLLDLAKLEAGRLTPSYSAADLAKLVHDCAAHFAAAAEARDIRYIIDTPPMLDAQLDVDKTSRILLNLLANAFKFTPDGGTIHCGVHRVAGDATCVVIEVGDSGPGIPEEARAEVFHRFSQMDGSATRAAGGTGLGLAIVHDFVQLMRGEVSIDTSPLGGASLSVVLPLLAPAGSTLSDANRASLSEPSAYIEPSAVKAQGSQPLSPVNPNLPVVMVVEDNVEMRHFINENLHDLYNVRQASDGVDALEMMQKEPPDLVLSDIMMPRLDGEGLLRAMRADPALRHVPLVMLTAHAQSEHRLRLMQQGAQDYLAKPFSTLELRARVANLVTMKRTRDILQAELQSRDASVETLAWQVQQKSRDLRAAMTAAVTAQEKAERLSRAKTDFINMISHELRTPLTAINLQLARLQRHQEHMSEPQRNVLLQMHASSARLAALIESLLQHNKAESGGLTSNNVLVDVTTIAKDVVGELTSQAEAAQIQVHTCLQEAGAWVRSDSELLRMIVSNLMVNALKFTPAGGQIVIKIDVQGNDVIVQVRDSGPGIKDEDQAAIFEPFVHLEPVVNKHTPGVGLGLTLVKAMTQALGGRISVHSVFGQGATFELRLPDATQASP